MRHLFPDDFRRPRKLLQFFDLVVQSEDDPADTLIADDAAVAIWRKPNRWRTPASTILRRAAPWLATFGTALPRALRLQKALERHHPPAPHWYLEFAGCVPERQGRGYGGAAIRARLREADAAAMPAALETATAANLPLYAALVSSLPAAAMSPRSISG